MDDRGNKARIEGMNGTAWAKPVPVRVDEEVLKFELEKPVEIKEVGDVMKPGVLDAAGAKFIENELPNLLN